MKTLILSVVLAGLIQAQTTGQTPKPAPSSATTEERLALAGKANTMLREQLAVEERHIEVMKAQIDAYEKMITAPAGTARETLQAELEKTTKAHKADGCQLMGDGSWSCPPTK
jgi:hypothetical protein